MVSRRMPAGLLSLAAHGSRDRSRYVEKTIRLCFQAGSHNTARRLWVAEGSGHDCADDVARFQIRPLLRACNETLSRPGKPPLKPGAPRDQLPTCLTSPNPVFWLIHCGMPMVFSVEPVRHREPFLPQAAWAICSARCLPPILEDGRADAAEGLLVRGGPMIGATFISCFAARPRDER